MSIAMFPSDRFKQMLAAARRHDSNNARLDAGEELAMHSRLVASGRFDAGESLFMARQLEYLRPGVMEVQYPELKGARLVPVDTNVDPGAASFTYQVFDQVGEALVTSDLSSKPPRADVSGSESNQVIRSVIIAYGYSIQEARAAMMAKTPLIPRRAMAARDIIERTLDNIIFLGNTVMGLKGLLNQSSPVTYATPNGASGDTEFETKTPDEIVADLHGIVNAIVVNSKEIEQPDTLLLPLSSFTYIASRRMGDGDSTTILDHFKRTSPYIKTVEATHKLESNSAWTGKRMVAYRKDPNKLAFILPQPFEQHPPQADMYELVTPCHARTGGVVVFCPKSIAYGDQI